MNWPMAVVIVGIAWALVGMMWVASRHGKSDK